MNRKHHTKRKRHHQHGYDEPSYEEIQRDRERTLAVLHVQAHEADIVHGAALRAQSLEVDVRAGRPRIHNTALIKLANNGAVGSQWYGGEDSDTFSLRLGAGESGAASATKGLEKGVGSAEVWVDRFDARLLLESLPPVEASTLEPPSPTSSTWSDFPEDSPGTFFLSPSEIEDYHRAKRRRMLDEAHERRLKEREEEDYEGSGDQDDETEPSPETMTLITRTAKHLLSASNPAQLEMRILANHGADVRFSFLRQGGRWHDVWLDEKAKLQGEKDKEVESKGLGGLADYDSDSDQEKEDENPPPEPSEPAAPPPLLPEPLEPPPAPPAKDAEGDDPDAAKEKRRARAREWMLSRKKEAQDS